MKFYNLLDIFTKPFSIKMAQLKGFKPFSGYSHETLRYNKCVTKEFVIYYTKSFSSKNCITKCFQTL